MDKQTLVARVRTVLNEYGSDFNFSISEDNVKLDNYIAQALPDAVEMLSAEGKMINPKTANVSVDTGLITLPDDFVSLISVKLATWYIAATYIAEKGSPEYRRAMNTYTPPGLNTPICFRESGNTVAVRPATATDTAILLYNAKLEETFNGDSKAADAVVYMAASLVLAYFEDDNGKNRLAELATLYLK